MMTKIRKLFDNNLEGAIVSQEMHKDGTPHLHCFVKLHVKRTKTGCADLDMLAGQHGNYQVSLNWLFKVYNIILNNVNVLNVKLRYIKAAKKIKEVVKYITKESNYIEYGITKEEIIGEEKEKKTPSKV